MSPWNSPLLAYLGYLAGHETIAACAQDPILVDYVDRLWRDEIIPVVPAPPDLDLVDYVQELRAHFANTATAHRTWQIAMDGSQKLPQRLLSTIRERLARGLPIAGLALAVAAWVRYVGGIDLAGNPIDVRDPLAGALPSGRPAATRGDCMRLGDAVPADAGEKVVVLVPTNSTVQKPLGDVAADMLRQCGMNVEYAGMDFASVLQRQQNKGPPATGGWSADVGDWQGGDEATIAAAGSAAIRKTWDLPEARAAFSG